MCFIFEISLFVPYENYIKSYALKQESLDDYLTHIEKDICYMSMIMSHRYDIDEDAFISLSKKYNLDFNTVCIDWNECFAHKLRIENGVIVNNEVIEDDDAIYFEFF